MINFCLLLHHFMSINLKLCLNKLLVDFHMKNTYNDEHKMFVYFGLQRFSHRGTMQTMVAQVNISV